MTPDARLEVQPVDRRDGLTHRDFVAQYLRPLKPVIVTDVLDHWPARRRWTPAFFRETYGSRSVNVDGVDYQLSDLIDRVECSSASKPAPYLRNVGLEGWAPELMSDIQPLPRHTQPNWLDSKFFPERRSLTSIELYIGGAGASFPTLHFDNLHTHAFLMQLWSKKCVTGSSRWLYPKSGIETNKSSIGHRSSRPEPVSLFACRGGRCVCAPARCWFVPGLVAPRIWSRPSGLGEHRERQQLEGVRRRLRRFGVTPSIAEIQRLGGGIHEGVRFPRVPGVVTGNQAARLRGWPAAVVAVVALGLAAVAFAQNRSVVHNLVWPGFDVQFRELASAQTLLDEGYGPDADYIHEHVWYNPMTAWIIAAATRLSGATAPTVVNRLGPYVNLAAPAALFLLTAVLFDGFAAVAAMAAFVFFVGTEFPFYYSASYSPWFAPESFGQAWLYLLLAALCRAFRPAASLVWSVACGVLLGLTFLTHTAPALLGGAAIVSLGVLEMRRVGGWRQSLTRVAVALAVAFMVSLPFDFEILWRYHLKIINQFPSQSPSELLDLNELPLLARTIALPTIVAAIAIAHAP